MVLFSWETEGTEDPPSRAFRVLPGGGSAGRVEAEDPFEDGGGVLKGSPFW